MSGWGAEWLNGRRQPGAGCQGSRRSVRLRFVTDVQRPPSGALLRVADEITAAIGRFVDARRPPVGHWEALDEAHVMGNLCIRQIEGTVALARTDMVLLPAAWATARSAFEIAVRIEWLLSPPADFEREARWLARVREGARYWRQIGDRLAAVGGDPAQAHRIAGAMTSFADGVAVQLPTDVPVAAIPNLDAMVAESDPVQYVVYKMASQYVHGTHEGGVLYRQHLGSMKTFSEQVDPHRWVDPMRFCWWALTGGLALAVRASGGDYLAYMPPGSVELFSDALRQLGVAASPDAPSPSPTPSPTRHGARSPSSDPLDGPPIRT